MSLPEYAVYAIRYGHKNDRSRRENFIVPPGPPDTHDGQMPIDYFVWAIVGEGRTIVVDTGFDHAEAARRGRELTRLPREGLALLGIDSHTVEDVIITHLHYDHAGTLSDFPQAKFHIQDLEMQYTTGRYMQYEAFRYAYTVDHVTALVRKLYQDQVVFHDGDEELWPGISVHHIGGHTMGIQAVRVHTRRGWLVLASDASHFYENMEAHAPFPIVYNVADMLEGHAKLHRLADSQQLVIPGHDPQVMQRYPAPNKEMEGIVVQLDADPLQ